MGPHGRALARYGWYAGKVSPLSVLFAVGVGQLSFDPYLHPIHRPGVYHIYTYGWCACYIHINANTVVQTNISTSMSYVHTNAIRRTHRIHIASKGHMCIHPCTPQMV